MKKDKTVDMTSGPIFKQLIQFSMPVLLGLICQRVYNFADVYIVGRFLGDDALAAVSIAGTLTYIIISLILGVTVGVNILIAQFYGAHQEEKIQQSFVAGIYVAVGMTIVLTVAGALTVVPQLRLMQTGDDLLPLSRSYLVVMYIGCGSAMLYNFITAVLRALGNSIVPLVFLIISSILNIFLDIVFVAWIPMGTAGAAVATVLAQLMSGLLCLIYAVKILLFLHLQKAEWKPDWYLAGQILRYGLPTGLQMSIISISDLILQAVINTYGTMMIIAYGISIKIEGFGFQMADAIGSAVATFTGQNIGAGNFDRVKMGVRNAYYINFICYGIFCPLVFIFAPHIMRLFTESPKAIAYGAEYMRIFSCFFLAGGILNMYHNFLRAAKDVAITVWMGICEVITRIAFVTVFPVLFGYQGLWFVSPLTWVCAAFVGGIRYYSGKWQEKARDGLYY